MEYVDGVTLGDRIKNNYRNDIKFTDKEILKYFTEIVLAIRYIHSKGILHRDLKPENVFIASDDTIKLGDFGLSRVVDDTASTICGTPAYMAPEIVVNKLYDEKADVWSLGVILYELITLDKPYKPPDMRQINWSFIPKIKKLPSTTPDYLQKLIFVMLQNDPNVFFIIIIFTIEKSKNSRFIWISSIKRRSNGCIRRRNI